MNIEQPFHSVTASPEKYDLFILERMYIFCLNEERDEHRPLFPRPSRKGNENKFEHACVSHYYSKYLYVCPTLKYQSLFVVLFTSLSQSHITHVVCSRQTNGPVHIRDLIVTGLRARNLSGLHRAGVVLRMDHLRCKGEEAGGKLGHKFTARRVKSTLVRTPELPAARVSFFSFKASKGRFLRSTIIFP